MQWIDSYMNRINGCLKRFIKLSDIVWIDSNSDWIVSNIFWVFWVVSFSTWHESSFTHFESIQSFNESIQSIHFGQKSSLSHCSYILPSPLNSKFIESFASILSRSPKLIAHTFFKIKHFFLESLCDAVRKRRVSKR